MTSTSFGFTLVMHIVTKTAEMTFTKVVTLPFVPSVETVLWFSEDDFFHVSEVEYFAATEMFRLVSVEEYSEDCPCKPEDDCCGDRMTDELKQQHLDSGWELLAERRGLDRLFLRPWSFLTPVPVSDDSPK